MDLSMLSDLAKGSVKEIVDEVRAGSRLADPERAENAQRLMEKIRLCPEPMKDILIFEMACTLAEQSN